MVRKLAVLFLFLMAYPGKAPAQAPDSVLQVVYLIGNTATSSIPGSHLLALRQALQTQPHLYTLLHLGDLLANRGLTDSKGQNTQTLDQLLQLAAANPRGQSFFIPGDKDWDNSGPEGLKNVRRLEQYLAERRPGAPLLVPGNGCPGPEVIDIGPGLRLIAINTQWWMHPYRKPREPDTDCPVISRAEFLEALEEAVTEAQGRNVLIVGHHPLQSNGVYGGHMPLQKHLFPFTDARPENRLPLPLLGSLYAAYRQNVGTPRDLAHPDYQDFKNQLGRLLQLNSGVVYASAHDYSLQLSPIEDSYQLVSGSFAAGDFVGRNRLSQVNTDQEGYATLTYYADGRVEAAFYAFQAEASKPLYTGLLFQSACAGTPLPGVPVNGQVGPCLAQPAAGPPATSFPATATAVAGPEYQAGPLKRFFFGSLYRSSWTQPVQVPYLYLSQTPGQLRPVKVGGGRQTISLRLRAGDGQEYVFRSVHKDPAGALPPELRHTVVQQVLHDIMATEQPYGAMPVGRLLDATDILHARPRLFVLGDEPALGPFRQRYAGLLGMLEERPLDPKGSRPGFGGADDIRNTFNFFRDLYKDHDNRVDARAYGKARAFDLLVGDWGRHPDNWRWAAFKQGKTTRFLPIPRDRDHAFSRWNGLIPWVADRSWAVPNVQDFNTKFNGIQSLTWPARHLDRALLTSLNRPDWHEIAAYLQQRLPDPVIEEAVATLPAELAAKEGARLAYTLKVRRDKLPQAVDAFYELLARYVDVVGSNKNEYLLAERLPQGRVRVRVYEKDKATQGPEGQAYFDRTFLRSETREIRLYGLDGKDVFVVKGKVPASIRLRLIGGTDKDSIRDESQVSRLRKHTLVYDQPDTKMVLGPESRNLTSARPDINAYDREAFAYNSYNPAGGVLYNQSDGLGITFGINYKRQRFRKPGFGSLYAIQGRATRNGNVQLTSNLLWRQAVGRLDVGAYLDAGQYFRFYHFFGLGNQTVKDDARFDAGYYRARYGGVITQVFLQKAFFQKSYFRLGPGYETFHTDFKAQSLLGEAAENQFSTGSQQLASLAAELNLDLRDKEVFTQRGLRLLARHTSYKRLDSGGKGFGLTEGFLDYYGSARLGLPLTLGLRLGGSRNYGSDLPFFKYTTLGLQQNLRGYVITRFAGDARAYLNSELRLHIGQVNNSFLPFRYGLLGFYDQGRVWYRGASPGGWHSGYGGGFYLSPLAERFTFSVLLQQSKEENLLFQLGAGFRFDQ
ncbi:MAG: hypothetical protein ACO1O1_08930 [Adhaeribacter sp.]